jgi:hypothetical protein
MKEPDFELDEWRRQWQADPAAPPDLRKMVESGTRQMRRGVAGEIATTVVMGGGSLFWAISSQRTEIVVLAIAIWIFIAIAWTASILLYRGAWEPSAATTAAFLEISILRTERRLQATVVQIVLYLLISTFDLVWLYYYRHEGNLWTFLSRPTMIVFLFVVTPMLATLVAWYRRRLNLELRNLKTLRRQSQEL